MWSLGRSFTWAFLAVAIISPLSSADSNSQELVEESGDAPGELWGSEDDFGDWQKISADNATLVGMLTSNDTVDVFAIDIVSEDGAIVRFTMEPGKNMSVTIQRLNQSNWKIEDFSNNSIGEIGLSQGIHAIRVERLGAIDEEIDYSIILENIGLLSDLDGEFVNLDWMFTPFYIFAGVFLILPLMIVLWWNRDKKWFISQRKDFLSEQERETLFALRKRFAEEEMKMVSEETLEASLSVLGDETWSDFIKKFGEAEISYLTSHLEVSVWRLSADWGPLLIGIKTGEYDWKMGAIRIFSPRGKSVSISEVEPQNMFENDDVYIGDIPRKTSKFLRVSMLENVGQVSIHVSGLVDGVPVAAVPTNLYFDSEE